MLRSEKQVFRRKNNVLIRSSERLMQASKCHLQPLNTGNMIYKTLIQYTTTGLSICQTTDVAKYNDYVVYNTVSGETPEVATEPIL
jgi:hypothetical protein